MLYPKIKVPKSQFKEKSLYRTENGANPDCARNFHLDKFEDAKSENQVPKISVPGLGVHQSVAQSEPHEPYLELSHNMCHKLSHNMKLTLFKYI